MAKATIIPGSPGLPFVGETFALFTNPPAYFRTHHYRYGMIFQTRIIGKPSVVVFGARAQQQFFLSGGDEVLFRTRDGYSFAEPFIGTSLLQMDGQEHETQRKLLAPAFQSHNYSDYLTRINRVFDRIVGQWPAQGTRVFYQEARAMAFRVSTSLILGVDEGEDLADLNHLIHTLFDGPLALVQLKLPFTKYGRALAARSVLDQRLQELIEQHRAQPTGDVLSLLLQARDEQGEPVSDRQLRSHLKLLLFAGYDTTTATLAWGMLELLRHPDLYTQICAEVGVGEIAADTFVTVEDMRLLPLLDAFLKETLRLHPVTPFLFRSNAFPCECEGYTIPAGWQLIIPLSYNHRLPEYFARPDQFDPARFLPPREEDKKTPYSWMAFGGGKHMCIGMGIAQVEMKTIFVRLLRQFDLQLVPAQDMSPLYLPIGRPKGGAVIAFQRRQALSAHVN
jgi:cytochrome P450